MKTRLRENLASGSTRRLIQRLAERKLREVKRGVYRGFLPVRHTKGSVQK